MILAMGCLHPPPFPGALEPRSTRARDARSSFGPWVDFGPPFGGLSGLQFQQPRQPKQHRNTCWPGNPVNPAIHHPNIPPRPGPAECAQRLNNYFQHHKELRKIFRKPIGASLRILPGGRDNWRKKLIIIFVGITRKLNKMLRKPIGASLKILFFNSPPLL